MVAKLNDGQKHLLRLVAKEQQPNGWAPVSKAVFPLMQAMPSALLELQPDGDDGRGRVRLTEKGQGVVDAMAWL